MKTTDPPQWNGLFVLPPQWSQFDIKHRQRHQRVAESFLAFVRAGAGRVDADTVQAWLLQRSRLRAVGTVREDLRCLGRLLRTDAVKCWTKRHGRQLGRVVRALHAEVYCPPRKLTGPLETLISPFIHWRESLRRGDKAEWPVRRLDRFLAECGVTSVGAINAEVLAAFLRTRRVSGRTLDLEISALQQFFRWLRRTGQLTTYPDAHLKPSGCHSKHRPYILSLKEIATLLQALRAEGSWDGLTASTMLHLIYACGLRISEAVRLRITDAKLDKCILQIRQTKFGKSRQIPIGRRATEYLTGYLAARQQRPEGSARNGKTAAGRFFINSYGRPVGPLWLRNRFRRACLDTGLSHHGRWMRVHDLRHSFAVHRLYKWYMDGIDPQSKLLLLSFYMGHVLVENTSWYLQMGQDLMRLASTRCARNLDEALSFHHEPI